MPRRASHTNRFVHNWHRIAPCFFPNRMYCDARAMLNLLQHVGFALRCAVMSITHTRQAQRLSVRFGTPYVRSFFASVSFVLLCCVSVLAQGQIDQSPPISSLTIAPGQDISSVIGKPISSIEIVQTGRWRSKHTVSSVRIGERLTASVARRAATELLNTGAFSDVQLLAELTPNGVALRIEAEPRRLIASRKLIGSPLDSMEVWHASTLDENSELTEQNIQQLTNRIRELHQRRGYPDTSVTIETRDTDDPHRVVLIVNVNAGKPLIVTTRTFVIPEGVDPSLHRIVNGYSVTTGDRADEIALKNADTKLLETLQKMRHPNATVAHQVKTSSQGATLFVNVTPGARLQFHFDGNTMFDEDQLTAALDYDNEPDRTQSVLADKLQGFYRRLGMLDATVAVHFQRDTRGLVDTLVFRIREGKRVVVVNKEFPCLQGGPFTPKKLRSEIDGVLVDQLPSAGFLSAVPPQVVDRSMGPTGTAGARVTPFIPDPSKTYDPAAYEKVITHLQDLYQSHGYLSARIGPVQVVRRACDRHSPAGKCLRLRLPVAVSHPCSVDPRAIPLEAPPTNDRIECKPDHKNGIECEPQVSINIPINLGPQATLYDVSFEGNRAITEQSLAETADLSFGKPASNLEIEQARRRILQQYRELGYAYANVRANLVLSSDHTRARARFIINESQLVIVDNIVIVGAERIRQSLIRKRVALKIGQPYRTSDVRKTEERIATLGTFSSVSVSLQDPYAPAHRKTVVVQVQERMSQYLDIRPGFSTGEGFRAQFEYGHLNIGSHAIRLTLRLRLSYLPDIFILDNTVRNNLSALPLSNRLERHNTATILFPEVGIGPLISLSVEGIDLRSNARDFGLTKNALAATLHYRPHRTLTFSLSNSLERNDVEIFGGESIRDYLTRPGISGDVRRLLLVPDGLTYAVAQLATVQWDRRDNPLGATRGTMLGGGVEHVSAFPGEDNPNTKRSDFLRLNAVASGYVPLTQGGLVLAATIRMGRIFQLRSDSETYPDRLFFLGGVDSIRAYLRDALVPQDVVDFLASDAGTDLVGADSVSVQQVAIRGGDTFINPRLELRIPITNTVHTVWFADAGNVWVRPEAFKPWRLRYASGSGLRIHTPIGPIAFDYGINLYRRSWEDFGAFHFSIGLF